jgi:RNA polymerase sigma-70 factor (ECF subfamily)
MNPVRVIAVWKDNSKGNPDAHGDPTIINHGEPAPAPGPAAPDGDLLRRMAEDDDVDAFAILFERHRVSVYRAALALTGDHGASEEVVMDTFRRAYIHRARLRTDMSPLPWLHRVALNLCYSRLGRRRLPSEPVTDLVAERLADAAAGPAANAEWAELRTIVREGIAGLSDKHRAVVILYYLEGRSLQETADALGLPLGTVKSRLHHALRDLRGRLNADRRFGGAWVDAGLPVSEPSEAGP